MSGSHPTHSQSDGPTTKQLRALRSLALSRGQTFSYPATKAEASREIQRLLRASGQSIIDREIEADELQKERGPHDATAVRADEVSGHGSSARWSHHPKAAS
jgi:hypothetical protein